MRKAPAIARLVALTFAATAMSGGAPAAEDACATNPIRFNAATVGPAGRDWLAQELQTAAGKFCAWWGASFEGPFVVDVIESTGPSMALLPAWRGERGRMLFPATVVRRRTAATIHEVAHVIAPNANRFLAEGLAVHAHDHLGGPSAYPNFGTGLPAAVRPLAPFADLAALDRIATPRPLRLGGQADDKDNYLVAGHFVRFLIERHGLEKFQALYALTPLVPGAQDAGGAARWQQVYGATLADLAAAWRADLAQRR